VQCVEIALPSGPERGRFVDSLTKGESLAPINFEKGVEVFVDDTAGLTLNAVQDLIEVARRTKTPVTRKGVLDEINRVMQADLGDLVKLSRPEHKPADIVGYANVRDILYKIFKRCENPDTAVPAILVSGPNGSGKTFQLEAYASDSGRVVIELVGLRGMYFGQTDGFFEKLRLRLATYGKVLILVDEAHTQFGSVHKSETHETEKRLAGNIIKMMGDPTMYGKVLWALMTSRPDELDPDVKSRCPVQIPIFDLEGEERVTFVRGIFERKKIAIPDADVAAVMERTANYSARDYGFFVKEVKAGGLSALATLDVWSASASIAKQRRFQALVAAKHCSYPMLLPTEFAMVSGDAYDEELMRLKALLGYRG
jgi:ATPases of the AAA+ class